MKLTSIITALLIGFFLAACSSNRGGGSPAANQQIQKPTPDNPTPAPTPIADCQPGGTCSDPLKTLSFDQLMYIYNQTTSDFNASVNENPQSMQSLMNRQAIGMAELEKRLESVLPITADDEQDLLRNIVKIYNALFDENGYPRASINADTVLSEI